MTEKVDLFDIPIYRLNKELYYEKMHEYIDSELKLFDDTEIKLKMRESVKSSYGGDWEYNEIIGYIKLYKWGNKVRCYYHETNSKRKVKTRHKQYIKITDKFCDIQTFKSWENSFFVKVIKDNIENCVLKIKEKNKNWYVDTTIFYNMLENIDWRKIFSY